MKTMATLCFLLLLATAHSQDDSTFEWQFYIPTEDVKVMNIDYKGTELLS